MSMPLMTPATTAPSSTADATSLSSSPFSIRLVHGDVLCAKDEQAVGQVLERAARKYKIGYVHSDQSFCFGL